MGPKTPVITMFLREKSLILDVNMIIALTSVVPCIVIYFDNKTNQMHNISNLFYFGTTLYMFQTVPPIHHKESKTLYTASSVCHTGSVATC